MCIEAHARTYTYECFHSPSLPLSVLFWSLIIFPSFIAYLAPVFFILTLYFTFVEDSGYFPTYLNTWTIPVATRSNAWVCGCSLLGLREVLPGAWMSVSSECCVLSGRGLCTGLITRPEESYRVWRVWVWLRSHVWSGCDPESDRRATEKNLVTFSLLLGPGPLKTFAVCAPTWRPTFRVPIRARSISNFVLKPILLHW